MKFMSKLFQSLTIILAPLYILRAHLFFPTTFLEVLILLTLITSLLDFLKAGRPFKSLKGDFNYLLLFFLLAGLLEVFISPNFFGGLGIYRAYFLEPILFFYCLLFSASQIGYRYIIRSLLMGALLLSLIGLLQKLTGGFSLAPYEIAQGRIPALYNSANSLALFLGPITVLAFALFSQITSPKRWFYLFLFFFFSLVIIWTKSRGGEISVLLSLGVFGVIIIFTHFKTAAQFKNIFIILVLFIVASLSIFYYQNTNFFQAQKGRAYTNGNTLQIRYFIWEGTIRLIKDHPFFGAGLDGFKTLYSNNYRPLEYQEQVQYPHNIIFTFWAETGLLGLAGFLLLLINSFSKLFKGLKESRYLFIGIGLISVFSYVLIHGMVDVPYFKNDLSLEFWVFMALVVLWSRKESFN